MSYILKALAIILLAATIIPILPFEMWFIRIFDFPRLQIFILLILTLIAFVVFFRQRSSGRLFIFFMAAAFCFQTVRIFPYTPLAPEKALSAQSDRDEQADVKVLVSNVYMENHDFQKFLNLVHEEDPDMFLTLESDLDWQKALEHFDTKYPHSVKVPQDNSYGMHLYSRLPLHKSQVKYWVDKEVPSISTQVIIPSGDTLYILNLLCLLKMKTVGEEMLKS